MLSFQTIQPHTLELLKRLAALPELQNTRLVDGTSLALQYGHRQSIDLDFFGVIPQDKDELITSIMQCGNVTIQNRSNFILQTTIDDIKVDFVDYSRYEWIGKYCMRRIYFSVR